MIREAGKATRGETDRRAGKLSVLCVISKRCLILTKGGFSDKKGFFVLGGPVGGINHREVGSPEGTGGNRNSCSFWYSHIQNDRGILSMSLPCGPDCSVKKSGLIPTLWPNQPCDLRGFDLKHSGIITAAH